jgi:hypothetical protein
MTKFKTTGVAWLTVALAAATPAMAQGGHGGVGGQGGGFARGGGAHFAGGGSGFRRGGHRQGGFGTGGGLAVGAIVGGMVGDDYGYYGSPGYGYGPGYNDNSYANVGDQGFGLDQWRIGDADYCAQRYRSYDPASGTYIGLDGRRHLC